MKIFKFNKLALLLVLSIGILSLSQCRISGICFDSSSCDDEDAARDALNQCKDSELIGTWTNTDSNINQTLTFNGNCTFVDSLCGTSDSFEFTFDNSTDSVTFEVVKANNPSDATTCNSNYSIGTEQCFYEPDTDSNGNDIFELQNCNFYDNNDMTFSKQ